MWRLSLLSSTSSNSNSSGANLPTIPEYITVHLGAPDEDAPNVAVSFIDYIKNVASNEIYPTWPENALRANILAIITYTLNRIYTEWYRSAGYDFDITSTTRYDQQYSPEKETFDIIDKLVNELFNEYIVKEGQVNPYFTQYCSGTTVTCPGLSQWGTVSLAEQGLTPYEILQNYYGDNINIIYNTPVTQKVSSYPGSELYVGRYLEAIRLMQRELNRIAENYPAIPTIPETTGLYDINTENSVRKFQEIFDLPVTGIVDEATWYKIRFIYNNVKSLSELNSEGIRLEEVDRIFKNALEPGDEGDYVKVIQYYLDIIGFFNQNITVVAIDGYYGDELRDAVYTFQKEYGLPITGIVDRDTWNRISFVYSNTIRNLPQQYITFSEYIFPGRGLARGISGSDVETLQKFLSSISIKDPSIPPVQVTGTFDEDTYNAVQALRTKYNLPQGDVVGPIVWDKIAQLYQEL